MGDGEVEKKTIQQVVEKLEQSLGRKLIQRDLKVQVYEIGNTRIYINMTTVKLDDFVKRMHDNINYCLLGNNDSKKPELYWQSMEEWKKVYESAIIKSKSEHDTLNVNKNMNGFNIFRSSLKDEDWEKLINRIRKDLDMDNMETQLKELLDAGIVQIICHGAPGTGKTYTIENLSETLEKDGEKVFADLNFANNDFRVKNFVQFHPSYDYTDFVEGLRPVKVENQTTFVRLDGIFKSFCRQVVAKNKVEGNSKKKYLFIIDEINRADLSKVFGELMYCFEDSKRGEKHRIATQYSNLKSYEIVKNENDEGIAKPIEDDCFDEGFYIPKNVVVIGTMNDIDRSVESFDFALQRRFHWIQIKASNEIKTEVLKKIFIENGNTLNEAVLENIAKKLCSQVNVLNDKIFDAKGLGEDYQIGQAYFRKFATYYCNHIETEKVIELDESAFFSALNDVWKFSLKSILSSYIKGKSLKIKDFEDSFITIIK